MAKCFNCGKNFDYEKYYGICPKCGTYNREETPEEAHMALHEQYDNREHCQSHEQYNDLQHSRLHEQYDNQRQNQQHYEAGTGTSQGRYVAAPWPAAAKRQGTARAKATPGAILVFVLLIIGIVGTIAFPILYTFGRSMRLGVSVTEDIFSQAGEDLYGDDGGSDSAGDVLYAEQTAPVVQRNAGEPLYLGNDGELAVTVGAARVRVPAGYVEGFPKGENLVAISVTHQDAHVGYEDYSATDMLYVGYYEDTYRACLTSYDMEQYLNVLGSIRIVDRYNISYGEGEGELLVFVPEEVTSLNLYIESRNEDTYEMIEIYEIPLEIGPGEEI